METMSFNFAKEKMITARSNCAAPARWTVPAADVCTPRAIAGIYLADLVPKLNLTDLGRGREFHPSPANRAIADCSTRRPLVAGSAVLSLLVPVSVANSRANDPSLERTNGANRFLAPLGAVSHISAIAPA